MAHNVLLEPRLPIAVIRLDDLSQAVPLARALHDGGMRALEFTLTNRAAFAAIEQVRGALGDAVHVGAGTVLTADDAHAAIAAGAQFMITPTLEPDVIAAGRSADVLTALNWSKCFQPDRLDPATSKMYSRRCRCYGLCQPVA